MLLTSGNLTSQDKGSSFLSLDGVTFKPGLRIQTRYEFNQTDRNNDFYIRRFRLKGNGEIEKIGFYNFEVKIDETGKFNQSPKALLEHAWFTFPISNNDIVLRVGLEDNVYSRNALTSDSKLLLMDRSLIKSKLTDLGVADNTIGILLYGRPMEGRITYSGGIFDNLGFNLTQDTASLVRRSDGVMATARFVYDFLDRADANGSYDDYMGSYIGHGRRLSFGLNAAHLSGAMIENDRLNLFVWGADMFMNIHRFTLEAEFDHYGLNFRDKTNKSGSGWYAQIAYLFTSRIELAFRYQALDESRDIQNEKQSWTSIGINYYFRQHLLKIQADYTFKTEELNPVQNNVFQLQLQLSF